MNLADLADSTHFYITGVIDEKKFVELATFLKETDSASKVVIFISSEGGDTALGRAMASLIRTATQDITTVGLSQVCSIAVNIWLASEKRLILKECEFMIHQSKVLDVNTLNQEEAEEIATDLKKINTQLYKELKPLKLTEKEELKLKMGIDVYVTAESLVKRGICKLVQ